ncbi:unnamed protein product [Polarella glacialis]|uniref:Uncharacterized protein n=1 Tax=Polarella glacialis TaxID=89957 RepID=A0A813HBX0_POLGL|nr:unnamed protein product [Polarella glacialis]
MMPSIPPPITHQRGGAGTPATGAELEQEEALKMQLMWAAAARASSTYGGSRYPGFQQPGASSLGGVDSSGAGGGRGNMGRGQNPNAGWEAYAQAAQQAAMSMGRGGYPASSGPSPTTATTATTTPPALKYTFF